MFAAEDLKTIRCDVPQPRIARITLARPKQMNACTWTMTQELQTAVAAKAPVAVRMTKMLMPRAMESTFQSSLGDAQWAVMVANPTQDAQEAQRAFREKRPPIFTGH